MLSVFVINLESDTGRMTFMDAQLKRLGLAYERVEAVPATTLESTFNDGYWESWERPLRLAERGCLLSHISIWRRVAAMSCSNPFLVLEDDVCLSNRIPDVLAAARSLTGIDHLTLEVARRKKLLARKGQALAGGISIFRLYQDRNGAGAYLLWPSGARKLMAESSARAGLADAVISRTDGLISYQAEPACAVQLVFVSDYGLPALVPDRPTMMTETPEPPFRADPALPPAEAERSVSAGTSQFQFKLRRIRGQVKLGLRALGALRLAERRDVRLNPEDFSTPGE